MQNELIASDTPFYESPVRLSTEQQDHIQEQRFVDVGAANQAQKSESHVPQVLPILPAPVCRTAKLVPQKLLLKDPRK